MRSVANLVLAVLIVGGFCAAAAAQTTTRVSVSSEGFQTDDVSVEVDITPDARYVTFTSKSGNLKPVGAGLFNSGLYWRDRITGSTVFIAPNGSRPSISDDGQLVAFESIEPLTSDDTVSFSADVFAWSAADGAIRRVSPPFQGQPGGGFTPHISGDGRRVTFTAGSSVRVFDRISEQYLSAGNEALASSGPSRISRDGRYVAFTHASDTLPGDTNGASDVYLFDAQTGTTSVVSAPDGLLQDLSADGRFVLFTSHADLFVRDVQTGTLTQVNVTLSGQRADLTLLGYWAVEPRISRNGRWVTFVSVASDLVAGDTNGLLDTFRYDRTTGTIARADVPAGGGEAAGGSSWGGVAADGGAVAFWSDAHNLAPGDTNFRTDVFVWDPQAPAPCAVTLSPDGLRTVSLSGGAGSIAVTAAPGCTWTAAVNAPWVRLTGAASGAGNGTVGYSFDSLPPNINRAGAVVVNSSALGLRQRRFTSLPIGSWDIPTGSGIRTGAVAFGGWALADAGVARIRIIRDAIPGEPGPTIHIGDAVRVAGARPDVVANNSEYPYNTEAGWGLMVLSNMLPNQGNGSFTFRVAVEDVDGMVTSLGARTIQFANATATEPFGTIDTPAQGETVSGTIVNFGWALTPQPASIPTDGSTIDVFIDGVNVGHPTYNQPRSDIAALFPGYANSNGPVGFYTFDTRAYADGVHTIAWTVRNNLGTASGIGSRYFTIHNGSTPATTPFLRPETAPSAVRSARSIMRVRGEQAHWIAPAGDGVYNVRAEGLERIELRLDPWHGPASCDRFAAASLPAGASLDSTTGVLAWQPAAGIGGTHEISILRTTCGGSAETIAVRVIFVRR